MNGIITVSILGLGGRGSLYADVIKKNKNCRIVAVCDIAEKSRLKAADKYNVDANNIFCEDKTFFSKGKLSDILIIASMDKAHYSQVMSALDLGYDILLEKPISTDKEEVLKIGEKAKKLNRKVGVCHVLRYTPFYQKVKTLIEEGAIGDVQVIKQIENVGYFHQAHSFVRGNWRNRNETSSMILQKCCHDMDIIYWLMGENPLKVSSFGSLKYFKPSNAPCESAEFCCDCKLKDSCAYSAFKIYGEMPEWRKFVIPYGQQDTKENLIKILLDKTNPFARCVFHCDNNVVDHQVANILFSKGKIAHLTMTGFTKDCSRNTYVYGTKGEITGSPEQNKLHLKRFGLNLKEEDIEIKVENDGISVHNGGDALLVEDFLRFVSGGEYSKSITTIEASVQSHLMAFAADYSACSNGQPKEII